MGQSVEPPGKSHPEKKQPEIRYRVQNQPAEKQQFTLD